MRWAGALLAALAIAVAGARAAAAPKVTREGEAGGTHHRLETQQGPVHVWTPPGYTRQGAGVVFYVHGFYVHVDEAWQDHELAQQFADSGRNALFIAPEAPADGVEQPVWTDLQALVETVSSLTKVRAPFGPWIAIGHSGAYRVLVEWLDEAPLRHVMLVDGLYGSEEDYRAWLDASPANQMTLVVKGTGKWADPFVAAFPAAVTLPALPEEVAAFGKRERRAKLLSIQSQYGHFELITEKRTLPVLLQRSGLPAVPGFVARPLPPVPAPPEPRPAGSASQRPADASGS